MSTVTRPFSIYQVDLLQDNKIPSWCRTLQILYRFCSRLQFIFWTHQWLKQLLLLAIHRAVDTVRPSSSGFSSDCTGSRSAR